MITLSRVLSCACLSGYSVSEHLPIGAYPLFYFPGKLIFFTRELISYWSMIDGFHEEDTVGNKERGGDDPTLKE